MVGVGSKQVHCSFYRRMIRMWGFLTGISWIFVEKESDSEGFGVGFGGPAVVGLRIGGLRFRGEQRILVSKVGNGKQHSFLGISRVKAWLGLWMTKRD